MNHMITKVQNGTQLERKKKRSPWVTMLFLPMVLVYLEVVFHLYMGLESKYLPIMILFGAAAGFGLTLCILPFPKWVNTVLTYLFTIIGCVLFIIEIICKEVLQQYYQLVSSAETAANNQLTDYLDAIIKGITNNWIGILLMLLPIVVLVLLHRRMSFKRKKVSTIAVMAGLTVLFHLLGLLAVHAPWAGDFTPKQLYQVDTNVDDQVEQLGMITMLRLDIKHTLFGTKTMLEGEFEDDFEEEIPSESPEASQHPGETTRPTETPEDVDTKPQVDTSPNVMDIAFDTVIDNTKDANVKWLHQYFNSVSPTKKNEYTGMFEGYNVIFITAEGFSKYLIDEERTPTLYKLANEGFVFENYYTPLHYTSTSGSEFQNLTGLYPKAGNPISMKETGVQKTNMYFSLANQMNRLGYTSIGFHNNGEMYGRKASHTNLGYDWNQGGDGFEMELDANGNKVWPQSDEYMMKQTVDQFINEDKFNVYYLTVSGHMPYTFEGDAMAVRNKELVADLPYSEATKAYIAANYEVEKALTYLVERLEEAGKLENTLIVMSPDHIPYFDVPILEELSGKKLGGKEVENLKESDVDFDLYRNSLIIWSGSMKEPVKVDRITTQVDILPTVSNLLGLEYDSRLLVGTDALSDAEPLVIFSSSSWLTDKGLYNRYTGEFTLKEGVTMTQEEIKEYVDKMKKVVNRKLQASLIIIEEDYYNILFGNE